MFLTFILIYILGIKTKRKLFLLKKSPKRDSALSEESQMTISSISCRLWNSSQARSVTFIV